MFVLSQYLLNASGMCKTQQILSYSIALGLILYSSIYLYLLFYNNDYLSIFNQFIIYIVVVDLLLSAFYYFNLQEDKNQQTKLQIRNDDKEKHQNTYESIHKYDSESDDDSESDEENESDEEDDDLVEQDLDIESQQYINNLIAQARLSENQRVLDLSPTQLNMEFQETEQERETEQEHEQEQEREQEREQEQENETNVGDENDSTINQDIEHIIDEVVTKKKATKRAPKKKAQQAPLV